jgi:hypothetical protein
MIVPRRRDSMTLTIQDLGALGELLGSVAVLATLVYLALQTRQNTMAIGAQLDAAVLAARLNTFLSVATSNELAEAVREDGTGDMTTNEVQLGMYWGSLVSYLQWQYQQARLGLLPTFHEAGTGEAVANFFTTSRGFAGYWEGTRRILAPEFVEWVEEQRAKAA